MKKKITKAKIDYKQVKPKKHPITVEDVVVALKKFKGMQYLAADFLDCHESFISRMIANHPELRELRDSLIEKRIDVAELKLDDLVEEMDLGAICFFLKTRAKHRGYSERQEPEKQVASEETKFAIAQAKELNES